MANRNCPVCSRPTIPISGLLVANVRCAGCGSTVGPHWLFGAVFFVIILAVTLATTVIVLAQFGIYAALLWFSFPVGAIGYLKARFSPLQIKPARPEVR